MKVFPIITNMSTIYDNMTAFYYIIVSLILSEHFIIQEKYNQISVLSVEFRIFLKPKSTNLLSYFLVSAGCYK